METPGAKIYAVESHQLFDVVALMMGLGVPYRFVAKMEVTGMPFIGTFMRQMGHLSFDRSDGESRLHQAAEMEDFLRKGELFFVFSGRYIYARSGSATVSIGRFSKQRWRQERPIIPVVALEGTREFFTGWGVFATALGCEHLLCRRQYFPRGNEWRCGGGRERTGTN